MSHQNLSHKTSTKGTKAFNLHKTMVTLALDCIKKIIKYVIHSLWKSTEQDISEI